MRRVSVVIFIDALGKVVADHHAFLKQAPGTARRLETVIGYSSSAIPSLLTGKSPREHGHFSMYRRDLGGGVFAPYRAAMTLVHHTKGRGKMRAFLKRHLSRSLTGYFELYDIPLNVLANFDLCQRRDLFRPQAIPGHETFFDALAASGLSHRVWTWRDEESRAFDELEADLRQGLSDVLFLYSAKLDALMHRVGTKHADVGAMLRGYESRFDALRKAAGDRELQLIVFSDHGMTDVVGVHDVQERIASTGLAVPKELLFFTDSTMARFWFRSARAEGAMKEALPNTEWGRWLSAKEMANYGIDFDDHRYGEAIYLLNAGHVIAPSYMGDEACAAMHGYGPEDPTADAWLYTERAPDVEPTTIRDLRALLTAELDR